MMVLRHNVVEIRGGICEAAFYFTCSLQEVEGGGVS